MSAFEGYLQSWLKWVPPSSQYELENWGRQGVYFLIIGFVSWGICLGIYRGTYCGLILLTQTALLILNL